MTHSEACTAMVKEFEGCVLTAYQDQGGVWTLGYGHVSPNDQWPGEVQRGDVMTQAQADATLNADLDGVDEHLTSLIGVQLNQNQYDSIVDFVFNLGVGNFRSSTLRSLLNQGAFAGASQQFLRWNHVDGVPNAGLTRRRQAEQDLFNTPV